MTTHVFLSQCFSRRCLVIEDSLIGLKAAKAAGMKCVITYTDGTSKEDFIGSGADAVFADLSEVSLEQLLRYLDQKDSDPSHSTTASPPTSVNDEEEKESQSSGHNGNGNGLKAANKKRILRRNSSTNNDVDHTTSEDSTAPFIDDVSSSEISTSFQVDSEQNQETSSTESTQEENIPSPTDSSPSVVKEEESIPSNPSNETVKEEVPNKKLPDDYKVYENGWSLHKLVTTRFFDK
jgi:hypothetical protein